MLELKMKIATKVRKFICLESCKNYKSLFIASCLFQRGLNDQLVQDAKVMEPFLGCSKTT